MWNDSALLGLIISRCLCTGTNNIRKGNNSIARESAVLARYFEEYIAVELHKTQALMNFPKIVELYLDADEHTLVKFFRKFPALAWMINTKK